MRLAMIKLFTGNKQGVMRLAPSLAKSLRRYYTVGHYVAMIIIHDSSIC
jgi:hypothetical protein